ncbi:hypothetical protein LCGC14_2613790, partial [marine sediment metagenome]
MRDVWIEGGAGVNGRTYGVSGSAAVMQEGAGGTSLWSPRQQ